MSDIAMVYGCGTGWNDVPKPILDPDYIVPDVRVGLEPVYLSADAVAYFRLPVALNCCERLGGLIARMYGEDCDLEQRGEWLVVTRKEAGR